LLFDFYRLAVHPDIIAGFGLTAKLSYSAINRHTALGYPFVCASSRGNSGFTDKFIDPQLKHTFTFRFSSLKDNVNHGA
jgi:hypothetical protein